MPKTPEIRTGGAFIQRVFFMNDNFMTPFDLVGDPIPEGWGKRGRPAHIPTHENRNRISLLLAFRRANSFYTAWTRS